MSKGRSFTIDKRYGERIKVEQEAENNFYCLPNKPAELLGKSF